MRRNIIPYEYYHDLDKKIKSKLIRAFQRDNTYMYNIEAQGTAKFSVVKVQYPKNNFEFDAKFLYALLELALLKKLQPFELQ